MKGKVFFAIIFIVFFSILNHAQNTVTLESFVFFYNDLKLENEELTIYYSKNKESIYHLGRYDTLLINYNDRIDLIVNLFGYYVTFENLLSHFAPFHDDKIEIGYLDMSVVRKKIPLSEQKNISYPTIILTEKLKKCCIFYSPTKRSDLFHLILPIERRSFRGAIYLKTNYYHIYNFVGKKNIDGRKIIRANQKKGNAPNKLVK